MNDELHKTWSAVAIHFSFIRIQLPTKRRRRDSIDMLEKISDKKRAITSRSTLGWPNDLNSSA
jgi:hypothetical protein